MNKHLNIRDVVEQQAYKDILADSRLKDKLVFVTLGGSHAYGTAVEGSDIDLRGCALNSKEEILLQKDFEQIILDKDDKDVCIYSINKLISLLMNCNPNVIELLGLPREQYAFVSEIGELLLQNADIFLSKRAVQSFGGYATQQLRRLSNKAVRTVPLDEKQQHIMNSMKNAQYAFGDRYVTKRGKLTLYLDDIEEQVEGQSKEIFADVHLDHIPVRDFNAIMNEITSVKRMYDKNSKRNTYAAEHGKLGKHMMHLVRLYLMCFDILEKGEINTYREHEREYLLEIRNGKYLDANDQPVDEFFDIVDEYERKLKVLAETTNLPAEPDYDAINKLRMEINEYIVEKG